MFTEIDVKRLKSAANDYTAVNMSALRIVTIENEKIIFKHLKTDIKILNSSGEENKKLYRIEIRKDSIILRTVDNSAFINYIFTENSTFKPNDIADQIKGFCDEIGVLYVEL